MHCGTNHQHKLYLGDTYCLLQFRGLLDETVVMVAIGLFDVFWY